VKAAAADYLALLEEIATEGTAVTMRVRGSSMLPAIPNGAVVRLEPLADGTLGVGQVVALRDAGRMLCHRVVRVYRVGDQKWVQTWGDMCPQPDVAVPVSSVIGLIVAIVEDGSERPLQPRPSWHIRARYLKRALRRLFSH
jgi:signal peptidase I